MPLPNDPLFSSQWHLLNTGQRGAAGYDINVAPIWGRYSGQGLVIAVNDDGMDLDHPDLAANLLAHLAYDSIRETLGQGFENPGMDEINAHGTVVGGIVGMVANNGVGGAGVAWGAKLVPALTSGDPGKIAKMFLANLAAQAAVSVNAWGDDQAFAENFGTTGSADLQAWGDALGRLAAEGRGGLGSVIAVSGGNERKNGHDVGLSNFTSNKFTIAVGAIAHDGQATDYSSPGASLLVTAPGGESDADDGAVNQGFGIVSADVSGDLGYNASAGDAGHYSFQNSGSSYSQPMVAGIAALMLEANPQLGFRDVQSILALTARQVDPANPSWVLQSGSAVNLGGLHYSRDFGYGLVDAAAAVRLAESWAGGSNTVANWASVQGASNTPSTTVPDNTGDTFVLEATATVAQDLVIERLEIDIDLSADLPSELSAVLVSPSGTAHVLFDRPLTQALNSDNDPDGPENPWPGVFTMGLAAFMGERSAGTWTLRLKDAVSGDTAEFHAYTVRAWGKAADSHTQYILTDAFAGAKPWVDGGGQVTLNAAAVSGAVTLSLAEGAQNTLPLGSFVMGQGANIENAFGGAGDDTLSGNALNNLLRGNEGNDTIDGGDGIDTALYASTSQQARVQRAGETFQVQTDLDGTDTLVRVERLQFADASLALDTLPSGHAGQTAQILRAILGKESLNNTAFASIGLGLFDAGMPYGEVVNLAVGTPVFEQLAGGRGHEAFVQLVYRNVVGAAPDANELASFVGLLDNGTYTQATLGVLAAQHPLNVVSIELTGLVNTGLPFDTAVA